jgi:hypothetical protein
LLEEGSRTRRRARRSIELKLDEFGRRNIEAAATRRGVAIDEFVGHAALYCLSAASSGRLSQRVPAFRRSQNGRPGPNGTVTLVVRLADEHWSALEAEAKRQGVTVEALIQHAALCMLADLDSNGAR